MNLEDIIFSKISNTSNKKKISKAVRFPTLPAALLPQSASPHPALPATP